MSRIGRKPVSFGSGVTVTVDKHNLVSVKGPKGELKQQVDPDIKVEVGDGTVEVSRPTDHKRHRALHGLYRTLIHNMVVGVSEGFEKKLELVGVGYKAVATGNQLELALGFSHPVVMVLPPEINVETETKRGSNPIITLKCIDKQLLGQITAKVRGLRPPEPYKGKGVKFVGEVIRRKAGKTAAKK
jgi:large subunit ribosomal protein L6